MRVTVNDGVEFLDERECRVLALPDGRAGALWRGLVFPVSNGVIDVGMPGLAPALCGMPEPTEPTSRYALRGTAAGLYVMLQGSVTEAELATSKLKGLGLVVSRLGRYLGEDIPGFDADWFLRLTADPTEDVQAKIATVLGGPAAWRDERGLRERLLAAELERALERNAEAKAALSRLGTEREEASLLGQTVAQSRAEVEAERHLREVAEAHAKQAQQRVIELEAERTALRVAPDKRSNRAVADEFDIILEVLLPRIKLMRDSRDVVLFGYSSRQGVYQALSQLDRSTREIPSAWKSVQGTSPWIERHVSDGQNNTGRAYSRLDRTDRRWEVLISYKVDQPQDIDWLRRQ
jgi:hypothetical protein